MNTVLGVVILVFHGELIGGQVLGEFPSVAECKATVQAAIRAVAPPPGGEGVASLCVDLGPNLKAPVQQPKPGDITT